MYLLMNKNNIVATLTRKPQSSFSDDIRFKIDETFGSLPIGCNDITKWLDGRKASKHSTHLQEIMTQLGCNDNEGFIRVTHAASINDTFWVKGETETVTWEQISLYQNQFSETISKLAFEGVGLYGFELSTTTPELTCEGSFRKCFRKESFKGEFGSDIFLYKRCRELGAGLEPYCEMLASEIAKIISPNAFVQYDVVTLHDKIASRCNLFTNEQYGYASYYKLMEGKSTLLPDVFEYFEQLNSEQILREMLVVDSLCFNIDRHTGNYGVLFDNNTLEVIQMSPIFDLNLSFLPHITDEEFAYIGDKLYECTPKLGEDFTRIGQMAMNDILKERVKDMRDFNFAFRGDDVFSEQRVKSIENIVRRQAEAILSKEKLLTRNVFLSQKAENETEQQRLAANRNKIMDGFMDVLEALPMEREAFVSDCKSLNTSQCFVEKNEFMLTIDFINGEIKIENNLQPTNFTELKAVDLQFYKTCQKIHKELLKYTKKCGVKSFNEYFKTTDIEIEL